LAARSQASIEKLKAAYPRAAVRKVDLTALNNCRELLNGVTLIFCVGLSFHSREKEMGYNMVDPAKPH
jgi:hypothetical protein